MSDFQNHTPIKFKTTKKEELKEKLMGKFSFYYSTPFTEQPADFKKSPKIQIEMIHTSCLKEVLQIIANHQHPLAGAISKIKAPKNLKILTKFIIKNVIKFNNFISVKELLVSNGLNPLWVIKHPKKPFAFFYTFTDIAKEVPNKLNNIY